jgi:MFS family permease
MIQKIFTRDFTLLFFAQFTFAFVMHILTPTLPIYLSGLGSTEVEIGVIIGVFGASALVIRPFVGRALLKTPEKNFLIVGSLLFAFISIGFLLAPPFWPILIVRIFQGIGFACFSTATLLLIANISPEAHRGQSFSYFLLSPNIALALAPAFGMFLINNFSFPLLFWVCLGLSLCSLFIINKLGKKEITPPEGSSIEEGLLFNRKVLPPSLVGFFFQFILGGLTAFFPLYAIKHGVANPGYFFTTMAIMLILGRAFGGKILDLYRLENVILPCLITPIISMGILAFSKTLPMFILVAVVWGIGHAFIFPALVAYTVDCVDSARGPAVGTFTAISDFGMALGPVIMGSVVHLTNYQIMFLSLVLMGIVNLSYFYFFVKKR